jgi:hypothetical protein
MSSPKKNSTKKARSPTGRASRLLNRGPIASLLHSYVESTENALMKLVKNAEPNGMLSRREILQREHVLQSLANNTKKFKNNFTRRQRLIAAASKRYHKHKEELEHPLTENKFHMVRTRLLSEKNTLRRLGVNIE